LTGVHLDPTVLRMQYNIDDAISFHYGLLTHPETIASSRVFHNLAIRIIPNVEILGLSRKNIHLKGISNDGISRDTDLWTSKNLLEERIYTRANSTDKRARPSLRVKIYEYDQR
jgi:hypothetical protein